MDEAPGGGGGMMPQSPIISPDMVGALDGMDPAMRRKLLADMLMRRGMGGMGGAPNASPVGAAMQGIGNGLQMALMSGALKGG